MDTSFESIRAKIAGLEEQLDRLRIAEETLLELDGKPARKLRMAPERDVETKTRQTATPDNAGNRQTIGETIANVLKQNGELSARALNKQIGSMGLDINGRAISFTLQTMKKRAFVKNVSGVWKLTAKGAKLA